MSRKNQSEWKEELQKLSTEELEKRLAMRWLGELGKDESYFDAICEVIAEREAACPGGRVQSEITAWAELTERLEKEQSVSEKPRKKRSPVRVLATAAAVIALLALMLVAVQAAGLNVFGFFGNWTDETFCFDLPEPPSEPTEEGWEKLNPTVTLAEGEVDLESVDPRLQEAYAECKIPLTLAVKNLPEDMRIDNVNAFPSDTWNVLSYTVHLPDDQYCVVCVVYYVTENYGTGAIYDKNEGEPEIYICNERRHYIFGNMDSLTAAWSDGTYELCVAGRVSEETLKRILRLI